MTREEAIKLLVNATYSSEYNSQKNNIFEEITWFLEEHPLSELLQIIADVVERVELESED